MFLSSNGVILFKASYGHSVLYIFNYSPVIFLIVPDFQINTNLIPPLDENFFILKLSLKCHGEFSTFLLYYFRRWLHIFFNIVYFK